MKRILCVLAVLGVAMLAGTAAAQTGLVGKGFKAGLAMSTFTGDDNKMDDLSPDSRMGLGFGGFLTFGLGPNFALQPEVLYMMKGAKYEEGDAKLTYKLNYLDIPVLFKYRFPTAGNTRPNLFAGPVLGFKMSADATYEEDGDEETEDVSDMLKSTDFGLTIGGGLDFAMASTTITFDVRYTMGMSDIPDDPDADDVSLKNAGWLVTVGLGF